MKKLLLAAVCIVVTGCGSAASNDHDGKDCFTLRDDEYCKVEKK